MEDKDNKYPPPTFDEFPIHSYDQWKEEAVKLLKGGEFDKRLLTKTFEGIVLQPMYTLADAEKSAEFPGSESFRRGAGEAGYIESPWDTASEILADNPGEANKLMKEELSGGANALLVRLSGLSTGCGESPQSGLHALTHDQVREAFEGISFRDFNAFIDTGCSSYPYVYLLSEAKGCFKGAHGHVGGSPLSFFAKNGSLPRPIDTLYDEMACAVKFLAENSPGVKTVLAHGDYLADAGADSVTELASVMSEVSEYMAALTDRGITADMAAKSVGMTFSLGSNHFMEIAKLRAARVLFTRIAEDFGAKESICPSIHAVTSGFNKTVYDPYVNVLRLTTEVFSGIIGGARAITALPFDSPIGKSDAHSRRISRNISIMMGEEFSLRSPIDPAGGSWYVETLTNQLIEAAWNKFMEYESAGGYLEVLKKGTVQADINKMLMTKKSRLATRALRAVGTNMYANPAEKPLERLSKINGNTIFSCTAKLADTSVDSIMKAFSEGESVLSVYNKINTGCDLTCEKIEPHRLTEDFEAMRKKTEEMGGIKALLLNMGPVSQHKARADFSTGFFEVGGFVVDGSKMFDTPEAAANAALTDAPDMCVICSTDDTYPELVPAIAKKIKDNNKNIQVILAGAPAPEFEQTYKDAGVDDFIHMRSDCLKALERVQEKRGEANV